MTIFFCRLVVRLRIDCVCVLSSYSFFHLFTYLFFCYGITNTWAPPLNTQFALSRLILKCACDKKKPEILMPKQRSRNGKETAKKIHTLSFVGVSLPRRQTRVMSPSGNRGDISKSFYINFPLFRGSPIVKFSNWSVDTGRRRLLSVQRDKNWSRAFDCVVDAVGCMRRRKEPFVKREEEKRDWSWWRWC